MKRIILFSTPTEGNIKAILNLIFPKDLHNKVFAYMPSDGANCPQQYLDEWATYSQKHEAEFRYIDNSKENSEEELLKLSNANILAITGGNTFKLLHNLRKSGLDKAIKEFSRKEEFVLAGFSAGALILTPTIKICSLPDFDDNEVDLKDLTGLGIVDFEVFPHYSEGEHKELLSTYRNQSEYEVKPITNEEYLVVDL